MKNSTALGAKEKTTHTITFKSKQHENFYQEYLSKDRYQDVYYKALVYCLGISEDTRNHVDNIYDFKTGNIKTECLKEGWQTSGSLKIIRMAFNLYCNGTPSVFDIDDADGQLQECGCYTVEDLFCCGYARYFWEAIKIRYPEYCFYDVWSEGYPHKRESCSRFVLSAGEKEGNHLPLLFGALHTAGNRGNVRTLPEYDRVSNPQDFTAPA